MKKLLTAAAFSICLTFSPVKGAPSSDLASESGLAATITPPPLSEAVTSISVANSDFLQDGAFVQFGFIDGEILNASAQASTAPLIASSVFLLLGLAGLALAARNPEKNSLVLPRL